MRDRRVIFYINYCAYGWYQGPLKTLGMIV